MSHIVYLINTEHGKTIYVGREQGGSLSAERLANNVLIKLQAQHGPCERLNVAETETMSEARSLIHDLQKQLDIPLPPSKRPLRHLRNPQDKPLTAIPRRGSRIVLACFSDKPPPSTRWIMDYDTWVLLSEPT